MLIQALRHCWFLLDGLGAAHDSYEIDSVKHRDWGVGHKRLSGRVFALQVQAVLIGGELGAALGCWWRGWSGVLVGGVVGGVCGS